MKNENQKSFYGPLNRPYGVAALIGASLKAARKNQELEPELISTAVQTQTTEISGTQARPRLRLPLAFDFK